MTGSHSNTTTWLYKVTTVLGSVVFASFVAFLVGTNLTSFAGPSAVSVVPSDVVRHAHLLTELGVGLTLALLLVPGHGNMGSLFRCRSWHRRLPLTRPKRALVLLLIVFPLWTGLGIALIRHHVALYTIEGDDTLLEQIALERNASGSPVCVLVRPGAVSYLYVCKGHASSVVTELANDGFAVKRVD